MIGAGVTTGATGAGTGATGAGTGAGCKATAAVPAPLETGLVAGAVALVELAVLVPFPVAADDVLARLSEELLDKSMRRLSKVTSAWGSGRMVSR
jgi:hypothetical protein